MARLITRWLVGMLTALAVAGVLKGIDMSARVAVLEADYNSMDKRVQECERRTGVFDRKALAK